MAGLGIRALVVTNAAGGIEKSLRVGDLMAIADHINFMGCNPLQGPNEPQLGPRFPDMSQAYAPALRAILAQQAERLAIALRSGVYLAVSGPSYETPAEIRMFRQWGADAVGMSTVPEVIAANHCGVPVLGLSCITNAAAGMADTALNHEEVQKATAMAEEKFSSLLAAWVGAWATTTT
jgi:purine-nucleoside phosphorylase